MRTTVRGRRIPVTATALAAACLLGALVGGCSSSASSPQAAGNSNVTLTLSASPAGPIAPNFNPFSQTSQFGLLGATGMVYEPLLQFDTLTGAIHPWLASAYAWSNGGKTLTFTIRSGVRWSSGQPLTASDVAFTLNLLHKYPAINLESAEFSSATASGNTVTVTFPGPGYTELYNVASTYIVPQSIWGKVGNPATYANPHPVGSGPYLFQSSSPQDIVLVRNPHYWQPGEPKVAKLNYVTFDSNTGANLALEQGQLDWASNFVPDIKTLYVDKNPADNHYWFPAYRDYGLMMNLTEAPFNNVDVRKAISDALDRPAIVAAGEQNEQPPAMSPTGLALPTESKYLAPQYAQLTYSQNLAQARQLLASAGFHKGPGGILVGSNGQPFSFTLLGVSSFTDTTTDLQVIAQELGAIGIQVKLQTEALSTWIEELYTGKYQVTFGPLSASTDPSPFPWYNTVLNSALSAPIGGLALGDQERWKDPATDALLAEYQTAATSAKQQQALDGLEAIMVNDVPVIPFAESVDWSETSTSQVTGWPSASDPYASPELAGPNAEYVVLHLQPAK
jgi:peptide/nickel transport system substrate-binding protein